MTTEIPIALDVKVSLGYDIPGLEHFCDLLLAQESRLARTRLFRHLVQQASNGTFSPLGVATAQEKRRWLTTRTPVTVNLRVRKDDPFTADIFELLAELPDHRSRAAAIRRLLFEAAHGGREALLGAGRAPSSPSAAVPPNAPLAESALVTPHPHATAPPAVSAELHARTAESARPSPVAAATPKASTTPFTAPTPRSRALEILGALDNPTNSTTS